MSTPNTPATGYQSAASLTKVIATETGRMVKQTATDFVSQKTGLRYNESSNLVEGLSSSAKNLAVEAARSASDQLNGVMGGKLASVLGSGVSSQVAQSATKTVTNLATGSISKVSSLAQNKLGSALSSVLGGSAAGLLGSTLSQVSDSGAKSLVSAKLAAGFIESGPSDDTLVADVYGVSDNNILNNLAGKISGFAQDKFDSIRKSPRLLTDLATMAVRGSKNWSVTKDNLANRIMSSLGGRSGLIQGLSSTLKDDIVNGKGLASNIYDTLTVVMSQEGYSRTIRAGNITSAREVLNLVNQVTRSSNIAGVYDIGSESALVSGIMRETIALGVPDAVDALVEKAATDEVAYNALLANIQVAIEYSDLDTLALMIDKLGVNAILGQFPNAPQQLLANYSLPARTTSEDYDSEWVTLQAIMNDLRPNWGKIMRNGEYVNDLSFYAGLSADAKTLLMRQEPHLIGSLIGASYQQAPDMISELQQMYPLVPLRL